MKPPTIPELVSRAVKFSNYATTKGEIAETMTRLRMAENATKSAESELLSGLAVVKKAKADLEMVRRKMALLKKEKAK